MWGEDKQTEHENTPTKSLLRGLPRRDVVVHLIGKTQVGKLTVKRSLDNLIQYCLSILTKLDDLPPQNISVVIGNPPPPGGAAGSEASVVGRILLCLFDISDVDSFKEAEKLLAPFKLHSKLTRVLVGNKIDLEYWRKVEVGSGVALAQAMCCKYCEISAHTGMHVDLVVDVVLREMFFGLKEEMLSRFLEKLKKDKVQDSMEVGLAQQESMDMDALFALKADQNMLLRKQDDKLREIEDSMQNLTEIGAAIASEIQTQGALLDSLGDNTEHASLKKEKKRKKVGQRESGGRQSGFAHSRMDSGDRGRAISPLQSSSVSLPSEAPSPPQGRGKYLIKELAGLEVELEETKLIMENIGRMVVDQSEKLERIELEKEFESDTMSVSLQMETNFQKKSTPNVLICVASVFCCPCFFTVWAWDYLKTLSKKAALFDNVLADTENAFQSLAKLLVFLREWTELTLSPCLYFVFGGLLNLLSGIISFVVVLCSTIVLILPSFFTLLIVRTSTVEKESKAFGGESH
jgi:hypothetical protein